MIRRRTWSWLGLGAVLAGSHGGGCATAPDQEALKAELKREILAEFRADAGERRQDGEKRPIAVPEPPTAVVAGRILYRGRGVVACRVQLVALRDTGGLFGGWKPDRTRASARTAADGSFELRGVPPGAYRLRWQIPGDAGWIRRLRAKPDVVVEPGKPTAPIEIRLRRPIGVAR